MLYLFQVDTGTMLTFDMNLALDSVSSLKDAIWVNCRIPLDRQVLLISGGECLNNPEARVCDYAAGAGTDTNPIFLFNRDNIEGSPVSSGQQPLGSNESLSDFVSIREQVDACFQLPHGYKTVVSRTVLSQQIWELGKDLTKRCEQYIHAQHLQHQGWAAVVANLEDIVSAFKVRLDAFSASIKSYKATKNERDKILEGFKEDLRILSEVVLIPALETGDGRPASSSLLDWIKGQDSSNDLESLADSCMRSIGKLDVLAIENLEKEARSVVQKAGQENMKEIKGLEERLSGLDKLLLEANKLVQEQGEMAQAFSQNQIRAGDLNDPTIFPDLCSSHQHQLLLMSKKHEQLEDIRRRCGKAKEELNNNLNTRLRWVMIVQQRLNESISRLNVFTENLKRLHSQIAVIKQIHVAKDIYCSAVAEVIRRKQFADTYLTWSNSIADKMDKVYKNEVSRRRAFSTRFDQHFVSRLFPGLYDYPSAFANERPQAFDTNLPNICVEEIEKLQSVFPTITRPDEATDLDLEELNVTNLSGSSSTSESEMGSLRAELEAVKLSLTEKEKEFRKLTSYQFQVKSLKDEVSELQAGLECEKRLRAELVESHDETVVDLQDKLCQVESRLLAAEQLLTTNANQIDQERSNWAEKVNRLQEDHEKEINELMERLTLEKDAEVKEIREKARGDVEGLRSRFRFMQSVEQKSPTDNFDRSLESFEKLPKNEDLAGELYRTIDLIQKSNPEGISPKLMRRIISKLSSQGSATDLSTGNPGLIRVRNISESDGRHSFEIEDDNTMRSVYGLDSSAIEATSTLSDSSDPAYKELGELITPPLRVVNVATKLSQLSRIVINSCKTGDYVFIYWNSSLQSYIIYLNMKNIHFLHTECLKSINHSEDNPVEGFVANVTDKEFCVARRSQNRYRVPQGFHFFRVRVRVIEILNIDSFLSSHQ